MSSTSAATTFSLFTALPRELRDEIYGYLGEACSIKCMASDDVDEYPPSRGALDVYIPLYPATNMLLVNKQFRSEYISAIVRNLKAKRATVTIVSAIRLPKNAPLYYNAGNYHRQSQYSGEF